MKITVITATGGRPLGFKLCELWMKRQTLKPDQWIVIDDFKVPTKCTMSQELIRREPFWKPGQMTLQKNLLEGLKIATGDIILFIEDDDWYDPNYIKNMAKKFKDYTRHDSVANSSLLIGEAISFYYHIRNNSYYYFNNINHASLFQTGFTKDLIPQVVELLRKYEEVLYFDGHLWKELKSCEKITFLTKLPWSVGIKGLHWERIAPTFGHISGLNFLDERYFSMLRKVVKEETCDLYERISEHLNLQEYHRIDGTLQERIKNIDKELNRYITDQV